MGIVRAERIPGSHFGREEVWLDPEMKIVVFCLGSKRAWKRTSRGDGDVSEHGSRRCCGNDDIELDTLTVML
jgi:hypothetical protein